MNVKGSEVRVGDDLIFLGVPHRITRIEPYTHPKADEYGWGPGWRIAYAQTHEDQPLDQAWGITLQPDGTHYEIAPRPAS